MRPPRSHKTEEFIFQGSPVVGWSSDLLLNVLTRAVDRLVKAQNDPLDRHSAVRPNILEAMDAHDVAGTAVGLAASGVRAGAMITTQGLSSIAADLAVASRLHVPLTVIASADLNESALDKAAISSATSNGAFGFFAGSAQEALDLPLISIRIAERALLPGICMQDAIRSRYDVSSVLSLEDDLIDAFLGASDDDTDAATPSQQMTLGPRRRRVPSLVSHQRPVGLNPKHVDDGELLARSAHAAFFSSHLDSTTEEAFDDFGSLTGRFYEPYATYKLEDADYVVVTAGSAGASLQQVVERLRATTRLKIGGLRLILLNPFPFERLRKALSGKRAVTVLDVGLSNDAVLSTFVRSALGTDGQTVLTFAGPPSGFPSAGDWLAAIENMASTRTGKSEFFVTRQDTDARSRVPALERTDQVLKREYPSPPWLATSKANDDLTSSAGTHVFGPRPGLLAETSGTLVRACATAVDAPLQGRLIPGHPPAYEMTQTRKSPAACTAVLDASLLKYDSVLAQMSMESAVVVPSSSDRSRFWADLPEAFRQTAIAKDLSVFTVTAMPSDDEGHDRKLDSHIVAYSILGAVLRTTLDDPADLEMIAERLEEVLAQDGLPSRTAALFSKALRDGFYKAERVGRSEAPPRTPRRPQTPWTLRGIQESDSTIFDPARFWSTVGYETASGRTNLLAPDPYLASRSVPAQTSVVGLGTGERVPEWLPENCTGCGLCWTFCPHSALPVTVAAFTDFIDAGKSRIEARGGSTTQVQRLGKHLAKRMHKLFTDDALNRFTSVRALGDEAVVQLLDAAGLEEESEKAARAEFESLVAEIGTIKIAQTEPFFDVRERTNKGSGRALTLTIDPDACTSCGICASVCPDQAIDPSPPTPSPADDLRFAREVSAAVVFDGDLNAETSAFPERELAHRLIDKSSYYSTLGGGQSQPGSGMRMALHLVASIAESSAKTHRRELLASLSELENRLKESIQSLLSKGIEVNDFNAFADRLRNLTRGSKSVDVHDLLNVESPTTIDTKRLQDLSDSLLDLESLRQRLHHESGLTSGLVVVFGDAPTITADAEFPLNPFSFPWMNAGGADALAIARGISNGLTGEALSAVGTIRRARHVADDTLARSTEITPSPDSLNDVESSLLPNVCLVTERLDDTLRSSIDGGDPIRIFWLDGLDEESDSLASLPLLSPKILFSQTSPAYPGHFLPAIQAAFKSHDASLTRIHTPQPETHEFPSDRTIDRMEGAVATRVFPLVTYRPDRSKEWTERWSLDGNPDPRDDWSSDGVTGRTPAEWFAVEGRFAPFFEVLPRKTWSDSQILMDAFLAADPDDRAGLTPYVELDDASGTTRRLRVAGEMVETTETIRANWRLLQEIAGVRSTLLDSARRQVEEELRGSMDAEIHRLESEAEAEIEEVRAHYDQIFREKLRTKLLALSRFGGTSDTLAQWLADMERQGRSIHSETPDEKNLEG